MKRHTNGISSGTGNFKDLKVRNIDILDEIVELRLEIEKLKETIQNMTLEQLKDVDTQGVAEGSSLGWADDDQKWVIFNEAGN